MNLIEAVRSAKDGNAVLFVGAGLSFLAKRENGEAVPDAQWLTDILLEQPKGTGSRHKLDRVAGSVIRKKGSEFVYDKIKENFTVHSVDERLTDLYSLPWKRIYTTNYDNAIEIARAGKYPVSSITIDETQTSAKLGSVIHLNGSAKRVSPANMNLEIALTDLSYAADRLAQTGWLSFFERDLNTSRAIIFAGYSLYDLEIDKILLAADGVKEKTFFFIAPDADEVEINTLERYGTVVPGGIDILVEHIKSVAASYNLPIFVTGFTALRELVAQDDDVRRGVSVQKLTEQLVYGKLPENEILARQNVFGDRPFLVMRAQDEVARNAIKLGPWRDILFVGEIASGKSASTLNLALYLINLGYKVFYAISTTLLSQDLKRLSGSPEKIAVIFDSYFLFRNEITEYASSRPPNHRIILTERSAIHELTSRFIDATPHLGPIKEITLGKIESKDIEAFEALVNFGGFWGERAGANISARQNHIGKTLEGSLYRLLIEIIRSEKVQAQLRDLLQPLSSDISIAKSFCLILILNSVKINFSINEWQYLFDRQTISKMLSMYGDQVRHFMLSDANHIYMRGGLVGTHILHAFMDDELVGDSLEYLYEKAIRRTKEGNEWKQLVIELVKFSAVEPMFAERTKAANIFRYYDAIRVYGDTRNNPDYWLQIGIAATVLGDLVRGKLCFENAYAREKARPKPNLTRIDNYFSRFQMRQAVAESNRDAAFEVFIEANERLEKQIFLDNNRHYPFKTGRYFSDVASKHFSSWDSTQKTRFKLAVASIKAKAEEWKARKNEINADVEILIRETTSLLRRI
ncbi:SIR2 family protein [Roseococcus pinisoli]|uniref:SIR2 family protein n=1 Tax=Roseococcus pinisoli TaxID=2835040 RepID=A0ABS5QA70_9PROT|nr:SIR2 family protein [Roseococcus pinisoli]MBS7810403.1 SIR2 family protein [Roseococcus pinisoli]